MKDIDIRPSVGGVDRSKEVDKISIEMAVETPFWMAIWAAEPYREIDVRMSYSDLKVICDLIDKTRGENNNEKNNLTTTDGKNNKTD